VVGCENTTRIHVKAALTISQRRPTSGLATPGRQDRRGEPVTLAGGLVKALVVDPRRTHLHRTRRGEQPPLAGVAVTDHQPPPVGIELVGVRRDLGADLSLQRGGEHPPRPLPHNLIYQRPASPGGRWRLLLLSD